MQIVNPQFLILIPVAAAALLLLAWRKAAYRPWLHFPVRLLIIIAVLLSISGFHLRRPDSGIERFILIDVSHSTGLDATAFTPQIERLTEDMTRHDRLTVIAFGRQPSVEFGPARPDAFALEDGGIIDRDATDLEAALRLVRMMRRPGSTAQVVLITDGNETTGSIHREIIHYSGDTLPLYAIPVERNEPDFAVRLADAPQAIRPGQQANVVVEVTGHGRATLTARTDEGRSVQETLFVNGRTLWRAALPLERPGLRKIEVSLRADHDTFPANNLCIAPVWVQGPPAILWISSEESSLAASARHAGYDVTRIGPAKLPPLPGDIQPYDLVVIEDVPAWRLPERSPEAIESYVRKLGGGLVMLGTAAFGPGGYTGSPVESALPVECDPEEKESQPVALAVAIDRSGSMNERVVGRSKLSFAQEGIIQILRQLKAADRISVVAFDLSPETVVPLQSLADLDAIRRRVFAMQAWGGTDLNAGLEAVYAQLSDAPEDARRHVIMLTDGLSEKPVDGARWAEIFSDANISISTVGIGEEINFELLLTLSKETGGEFHLVEEIQRLPDIFASEARPSDTVFIRHDESGFPVRILDTVLTRGLTDPPRALAYVLVKPKNAAWTAIEVAEGYSLLTIWRYGAGNAAAFAAPAGTFGDWSDAGALWAHIIEHTARAAGDANAEVNIITSRHEARIELAVDELHPYRANIVTPGGRELAVDLEQTAPGLFAATFELNEIGVYPVTITRGEDADGGLVSRAAAALSYSPEWVRLRANRDLLDEITRATGGIVLENLAALPAPSVPVQSVYRNLSWLPLLIALALFIVELALP